MVYNDSNGDFINIRETIVNAVDICNIRIKSTICILQKERLNEAFD
ncbi:hypothetical protein KPL35_15280 [Clostridium sp. CF011]|nr:hypothetical protein [Clostridium sp. CF011]MBU3093425.1 hypothetical protein [Clostridium sp. CF011]WAG71270.1 hypothetical protein LL036_07655 [Clostridium sp. CF011]